MITIARIVSALALVGTLLPPILGLAGRLDTPGVKLWMLLATVAWFVATPVWMDRAPKGGDAAGSGAGQ
jgi:hypothetical protein